MNGINGKIKELSGKGIEIISIKKADHKGRITIPKELRKGNGKYVLATYMGMIVLSKI